MLVALLLFAAADLGCYGMSYAVYGRRAGWRTFPWPPSCLRTDLGGRVFAPPEPLDAHCKLWTGGTRWSWPAGSRTTA